MKDNFEQQDENFKKIVLNIYNDVDIPETTGSWKKAQKQLEKRRRRIKWVRRTKVSVAIVAVSLFINLTLNLNMSVTYADFSSLFKQARNQMIQIFFQNPNTNQDTSHAKTPPPIEEGDYEVNSATPEQTTLEKARTKMDFSLLAPTYIPEGYRLDIVRIYRESKNHYKNAYLEYVNGNGEIIKLNQMFVDEHSSAVKTDIAEGAGELKETAIHGDPAILVILPKGFHYLAWLTKDMVRISVSGKISEQDIMKFAESLHE